MKRIIFLFLLSQIIEFSFGFQKEPFLFEFQPGGGSLALRKLLYTENDSNIHVVIPGKVEYNGEVFDVTEVSGEYAIDPRPCYSGKAITSITFPKEVTYIATNAFKDCTELKEVKFSSDSQLSAIGECAFLGCESLKSFCVPPSVKRIGSGAFMCSNLEELIISDGVHHDVTTPVDCGIIITDYTPVKRLYLGRNLNFRNPTSESGDFCPLQTIELGKNVSEFPHFNDFYFHDYQVISMMNNDPPTLTTLNDTIDWRRIYFDYRIGFGDFTTKEYENTVINVPHGALAAYQTHPVWGKFLHINEVDFPNDEPLAGDVSGDGRVNVSDVAVLINQILGIEPLDTGYADVNGDECVNVSDVASLINIILGITTEPESLTATPVSATLFWGDTLQMTTRLKGIPKNTEIVWSSSSPDVATVDPQGLVKTTGVGEASIIANVPGRDVTDTCHVTVSYKDNYSIKLDRRQLCLYDTGVVDSCFKNYTIYQIIPSLRFCYPEQDTLHVLTLPAFENQRIMWNSSDTTIVTITQEGVAKKVGEGTAKITASLAQDSSVISSCNVFCFNRIKEYSTDAEYPYFYNYYYQVYYSDYSDKDYSPPVYISPEAITVRVGEIFTINMEVSPNDASFMCFGYPKLGNSGIIELISLSPRTWIFKALKPGYVNLRFDNSDLWYNDGLNHGFYFRYALRSTIIKVY